MSNIRSIQSKETFRTALLACLEENPLNDIRVKNVIDRAGLNRTTFYKYYKDIHEIIDELVQEQLEQFKTELKESNRSSEELLKIGLDSLKRVKAIFHIRSGETIPEYFKTGLIETVKECKLQAWKNKLSTLNADDAEIVLDGLIAAALHMALEADENTDREQLIKTINSMFTAYIEQNS